MVVRGFLDYLRSAAVLMRGLIVNFFTFIPYLLGISICLALLHHWMLEHPYRLTLIVLVGSLVYVLLSPGLMLVKRTLRYQSGWEGSVKKRFRVTCPWGS